LQGRDDAVREVLGGRPEARRERVLKVRVFVDVEVVAIQRGVRQSGIRRGGRVIIARRTGNGLKLFGYSEGVPPLIEGVMPPTICCRYGWRNCDGPVLDEPDCVDCVFCVCSAGVGPLPIL
jgi:hypothetical protein